MQFDKSVGFTKENIDVYLKKLAEELKKQYGRNLKVELVLVGGASVLEYYNFRGMSMDLDGMSPYFSLLKPAINQVGDMYQLPNGWLNADFVRTESYSPKLPMYSKFYKRFCGVLEVRLITAEHLIAMKLKSGRKYKKDFSDVVGILEEHKKQGSPLSFAQIKQAVIDLYGDWSSISEEAGKFVFDAVHCENITSLYDEVRSTEQNSFTLLKEFDHNKPGVVNEENVDYILSLLKNQEQEDREL